jgi:hypothetical protein
MRRPGNSAGPGRRLGRAAAWQQSLGALRPLLTGGAPRLGPGRRKRTDWVHFDLRHRLLR